MVDEWFRYPPNQGMYEKVNIDYYVVKDVEEFTRTGEIGEVYVTCGAAQ
jgi:hypothetical protein